MNESLDVVVAGGGPAGSAAALDLSRRGLRVALIEQSTYENPRIGETLPPEIRAPLTKLGVWQQFLASGHLESYGIRSAWETPVARHHDFLYNPHGCGWHVDRARFDSMLACAAARAGAELIVSAGITAVHEEANGRWLLEVAQGGTTRTLRARMLVDATGRRAFVSRKLEARAQAVDRLIGAVAVLPSCDKTQWTLIEAVENGWWYSVPLPGERLVLAYMTDSDLWRNSGWEDLLQSAPLTLQRASITGTPAEIRIVSAATVLRKPVRGPNWIAVGDAALAFDPLSGQGVHKAIESAVRASAAVASYFESDPTGIVEYESWTVDSFRSYLAVRGQFYGSVERWPGSVFWARRKAVV